MCVVSNMGDMGKQMWPSQPNPFVFPQFPSDFPQLPGNELPGVITTPGVIPLAPIQGLPPIVSFPTKAQFEAFLDLLRAAIKFDEITGQKECQQAAKTAWIKTMCDHFGLENPVK